MLMATSSKAGDLATIHPQSTDPPMKKSFLFLVAAATALAMMACSRQQSADQAAEAAADNLADAAPFTFVLGLDDSFPPMGFRDDAGDIVGYDIDLAKAVCERLGWVFQAQPIDWDAKEMELDSGTITCIWNGFTLTDERKEKMCCTPAYLGNAQVAVVRADSGIASLADLAGKKVGTQTGSSGEECVNKNEAFKASLQELVLIDNYLNAFMQLESGAIDAIVMDEIVAAYQIPVSGKAFAMLGEHLAPEEYGIAFRKDNTALRDQVWDALKALAAEGKVAEIDAKWFAKDLSVIK